jgi:hypothetical protein
MCKRLRTYAPQLRLYSSIANHSLRSSRVQPGGGAPPEVATPVARDSPIQFTICFAARWPEGPVGTTKPALQASKYTIFGNFPVQCDAVCPTGIAR